MKIVYVHHALRDMGNPPSQNDDLKELGRQDARIVAKILEECKNNGWKVKSIYSSPFYRCMETSRIINETLNVDIIQEPRFNEFKSVENEDWVGLQNRVRQALFDIVDTHQDDETVICVTSGVNVGAFISLAYKFKPSKDTPFIGVPSCSPLIFNITKDNFI